MHPNYEETANIVLEFLNAAINFILYVRNIYPPSFFEKRKIYGIPTRQSIHPRLNAYILDLLKAIKPDLLLKRVSRVYITIIDKQSNPVEKYCFQIRSMVNDLRSSSSASLNDIQAYLRTFLLKISCLDSTLVPVTDCTWMPWIEITGNDPKPVEQVLLIPAGENDLKINDGRIIPLKTMNTGILKMELFVEESTNKVSF